MMSTMSLPAWGEWIEMRKMLYRCTSSKSLPAWGEWIEIALPSMVAKPICGLSPHGESGLKSKVIIVVAF